MCPVRTAVERAFDAKLVVGGGLGGLGGAAAGTRCGQGMQVPPLEWVCAQSVARRTCGLSHGCVTRPLSPFGATSPNSQVIIVAGHIVGCGGWKGGRRRCLLVSGQRRLMLPPLPPPLRLHVRKPVCVRACALMCEAEYCFVWICVYYVTFKPCNQGTIHTYHNISCSRFFICLRVLLSAESTGGVGLWLERNLKRPLGCRALYLCSPSPWLLLLGWTHFLHTFFPSGRRISGLLPSSVRPV
jgi:hypothetical protein